MELRPTETNRLNLQGHHIQLNQQTLKLNTQVENVQTKLFTTPGSSLTNGNRFTNKQFSVLEASQKSNVAKLIPVPHRTAVINTANIGNQQSYSSFDSRSGSMHYRMNMNT